MVASALIAEPVTPVAVLWCMGDLVAAEGPVPRVVDCALVPEPAPMSGPGYVWRLSVALEPLVSKFLAADGNLIEVQNFRYVGTDGIPRRMLVCGSCGHIAHVDASDFMSRALPGCCRRCESGFSPRCVQFHAYGSCDCCRGGTEGVP